jgi:hypothetical protein
LTPIKSFGDSAQRGGRSQREDQKLMPISHSPRGGEHGIQGIEVERFYGARATSFIRPGFRGSERTTVKVGRAGSA